MKLRNRSIKDNAQQIVKTSETDKVKSSSEVSKKTQPKMMKRMGKDTELMPLKTIKIHNSIVVEDGLPRRTIRKAKDNINDLKINPKRPRIKKNPTKSEVILKGSEKGTKSAKKSGRPTRKKQENTKPASISNTEKPNKIEEQNASLKDSSPNSITNYFKKGVGETLNTSIKPKQRKPCWAGAMETFKLECAKKKDPYELDLGKALTRKTKKKMKIEADRILKKILQNALEKKTSKTDSLTLPNPGNNQTIELTSSPNGVSTNTINKPSTNVTHQAVNSNCDNLSQPPSETSIPPVSIVLPVKNKLITTNTAKSTPKQTTVTRFLSFRKSTPVPPANPSGTTKEKSPKLKDRPMTQPESIESLGAFGNPNIELSPIKLTTTCENEDPVASNDIFQEIENCNLGTMLDELKNTRTSDDYLYTSLNEYPTLPMSNYIPGLFESPLKVSPVKKKPKNKERESFRRKLDMNKPNYSQNDESDFDLEEIEARSPKKKRAKRDPLTDREYKRWQKEESLKYEEISSYNFVFA